MTTPFNVLFLCTGKGRFAAYSAGSHPGGAVNPCALELLAKNRIDTSGLRSKSWGAFSALSTRINLFLNLPVAKLDRLALKRRLGEIGKAPPLS